MRIKGANIRLLKNPTPAEVRPTLEALRQAGCNGLAINTIHYAYLEGATLADVPVGWYPRSSLIFPDIGQDPDHPISETCDIARVHAVAEMAFDMGFSKVVLKPMIDPHYRGGWRGWITVPRPLIKRFADDYARFLRPYAEVAQELECDLCMGTEMYLVSRELGAAFWEAQVYRLRQDGFTRQLTYAANWGNPDDPQAEYKLLYDLWRPQVNYIGIDAYWPFDSVAAAPARWDAVIAHLQDLQVKRFGLPLVFTEIGWPNTPEAATDPWGNTYPPGEHTTAVSGELWRIARSKLEDVLEGWYAWEAGFGGTKGGTHDILGTGLEPVVWGAEQP